MKTKKKILSLLLAVVMIVGLLPMMAVPAYAAGPQQIRILGSDDSWTTYTLGTDTLPTGLSYDAINKRIVMENYSGKAIQALGESSDWPYLKIYVKGNNTLTGGSFASRKDNHALSCAEGPVILTGETGATLTINTDSSQAVYARSGSGGITVQDLTFNVTVNHQSGVGNSYGSVSGLGTTTYLKGSSKLTMSVATSVTSGDSNVYGIYGSLTMWDSAEADITVSKVNVGICKGIEENATFNGTGKLSVKVTDATSASTYVKAINYSPTMNVPYTATSGGYDQLSVVYERENTASNADLFALEVSNQTLSPVFDKTTTSYTLPDLTGTGVVYIKATVAAGLSTLKINGVAAVSAKYTPVPLNIGDNAIPVVVTGADGSTTQTYTINVKRISAGKFPLTVTGGTVTPLTVIDSEGKVEAGEYLTFTADTPDPSLHKIFDYWYVGWVESDGSSNGNTESTSTFSRQMYKSAMTVKAVFITDPDYDTTPYNLSLYATNESGAIVYIDPTPSFDPEVTKDYSFDLPKGYDHVSFELDSRTGQTVSVSLDEVPATLASLNDPGFTLTKDTAIIKVTLTAPKGDSATYTFTIYRNKDVIPSFYAYITDGYQDVVSAKKGDVVELNAKGQTGKVFLRWETEEVIIPNAYSEKTAFVMPEHNVFIEAIYTESTIAVPLTELTLTTPAAIGIGESVAITAQYTPENTTAKTIDSWSSSDTTVAEVVYGVVTGKATGTADITATIGSISSTCTITVTDKKIPTVTVNPITVTYTGTPVDSGMIVGTATFGGAEVSGSWSFEGVPFVWAGSSAVSVRFTPSDSAYAAVVSNLFLTITQGTPTGTPQYTAITQSGKTLADVALTVGGITPAGSIAWNDASSTVVTANTAYGWTFTPTDTSNYTALSGTITPYTVSSGGGGGSSSNINATLSDSKVEFEKNEGNDLRVTLRSGSYSLTSIKNGSYTLREGKDYTISGITVTIKASYLDSLEKGKHSLTFDMSGGTDPVLIVTVTDTSETNSQEEKPSVEENINFEDVKSSDWFYDAVNYVYNAGLMKGNSDTTFGPYTDTTRGMIVTILHRLEGSPKADIVNSFTDVGADKYYTVAVTWASENKIVSGYGNDIFGPENSITREQLAVILMNYAKYKGYDVSMRSDISGFADVEYVSAWAKEAMSWANAAGLIQGSQNQLMPTGNAQRSHVAAILQRFLEIIAK